MAEAEHECEESHEDHPEPQLLPQRRESDAEEEEKRVPRDRARLDSRASLDYLEKADPEGKGSERDYGGEERIAKEFTRTLRQRRPNRRKRVPVLETGEGQEGSVDGGQDGEERTKGGRHGNRHCVDAYE